MLCVAEGLDQPSWRLLVAAAAALGLVPIIMFVGLRLSFVKLRLGGIY